MTKAEYLSVGRASNGAMLLRTRALHLMAKLAGVQFHIGGWPYGSSWKRAVNRVELDPSYPSNPGILATNRAMAAINSSA